MGKKSKDKRDIYYRKSKEEGWRARSAFKLIQIADKFNLFKNVTNVVDLCAAPGGWSQVLSRVLYLKENVLPNRDQNFFDLASKVFNGEESELQGPKKKQKSAKAPDENVKIVAVDLQPMAPLPGVIQIQGDITSYSTAQEIITHFEGRNADLVVCDGAPDVTGLHDLDVYIQSQLVLGALHIACNVLKERGNFIAKVFRGKQNSFMCAQFKLLFEEVYVFKPPASRNSSLESYIVALHYKPPDGFDPTLLSQFLGVALPKYDELSGINRKIIPFLVSGDLNAYDPDANYPLKALLEFSADKYETLPPVQPPLNKLPKTKLSYEQFLNSSVFKDEKTTDNKDPHVNVNDSEDKVTDSESNREHEDIFDNWEEKLAFVIKDICMTELTTVGPTETDPSDDSEFLKLMKRLQLDDESTNNEVASSSNDSNNSRPTFKVPFSLNHDIPAQPRYHPDFDTDHNQRVVKMRRGLISVSLKNKKTNPSFGNPSSINDLPKYDVSLPTDTGGCSSAEDTSCANIELYLKKVKECLENNEVAEEEHTEAGIATEINNKDDDESSDDEKCCDLEQIEEMKSKMPTFTPCKCKNCNPQVRDTN